MRLSLHRNIHARQLLELFLLAAVTSLLGVRFYLFVAGYPQIGGDGLHIAHMLWGGLLMLLAVAMALSFLGARILRTVAIVGGVGFGIFIDELGKFITRDNNYFYQPAIGLIYAVFIVLYLTFSFLSRARPLSSREYHLNALAELEEAVLRDMDEAEKRRITALVAAADPNDPVTHALKTLLATLQTVQSPPPMRLTRWWRAMRTNYARRWRSRRTNRIVQVFFITEASLFVAGGLILLFANIDSILDLRSVTDAYPVELAIGQLVSALVAAGLAVWGVVIFRRSRLQAFEQFRRATLVNIFLTQFFMFARIEFAALPGFLFNLVLLGFISYAMYELKEMPA